MFRRGDHRHRVVIGKDTRPLPATDRDCMVAGFTSVGMDVASCFCPMPTAGVPHADPSMRADLGGDDLLSALPQPDSDNGNQLFGPGLLQSCPTDVETEVRVRFRRSRTSCRKRGRRFHKL